jgi:hypothetical protein
LVSPPAPLRAVRHIVEPLVISGPRITRMMRQRTFFGYQPPQQHAHPWSGQRVPDAAIGNTRLFEAMRSGRFLLLDRTAGGHATRTAAADWQQRITPPHAADEPMPGWPVVLLVRPDGYAAWATDAADGLPEVRNTLQTWCGTPHPGSLPAPTYRAVARSLTDDDR